jgi:hypothetical protein
MGDNIHSHVSWQTSPPSDKAMPPMAATTAFQVGFGGNHVSVSSALILNTSATLTRALTAFSLIILMTPPPISGLTKTLAITEMAKLR